MTASASAPDPTALDAALDAATENLIRAWSEFVLASVRRHGEQAAPLVLQASLNIADNAQLAGQHMLQAMQETHARRFGMLRPN